MAKATLLLADDIPNVLKTFKKKLRRRGYKVLTASNPAEAREILESKKVDVAILDLRLNDWKPDDRSGLEIAQEVALDIPKIIFSEYKNQEAAIEALEITSDGLPRAVSFVDKAEEEELFAAIRKAINLIPHYRRSLDDLAGKIDDDYDEAQRHSRVYFLISILSSLFGFLIILFALYLVTLPAVKLPVTVATFVTGAILEGIGFLAFKRSDVANERMDRYHGELLHIKQLDILLSASNALAEDQEAKIRELIITTVLYRWFNTTIAIQNESTQETS